MSTSTTTTTGFNLALLRCAAGTDVGMRREENQDSFGVIKRLDFQAFFVADGMGGAQGGATASRMAIGTLQEILGSDDVRISPDFLNATIQQVNQRIFDKGSTEAAYAGMGTTLVGLVFTADGVLAVNVGDSRAYRVRHQSIEQVSKDHTLLNELVQSGTLAPQDAHDHPVSHMLTRSLGPVADVEAECKILAEIPENGDVYVLCSDGLYNYVPAEEILAVVRQNPLDDANQILINLANQRGGGDNITVLVIAVGEKSSRGRKPTLPFPAADTAESEYSDADLVTTDPPKAQTSVTPLPPPVEEPKDLKAQRRALRSQQRRYVGTPRLLPTFLLLGSTLAIGLVLGGLIRRVSVDGMARLPLLVLQDDPQQKETVRPPAEAASVADGNSLAALARQIRAEGGTAGGENARAESLADRTPEQIRAAIQRLEQQIQSLELTTSSVVTESIDALKADVERLEKEYSAIESSLDVASRAVTLWLSRQVAFESQSNSAESLADVEQVAAYSAAIKEKLSALSTISYQYRSKADDVELYPNNASLRADLEGLQAKLSQLRLELQVDVRRSLSTILANAYKDYETIKIRRDILWLDLQAAKRELDVQIALSDGDPSKRAQLIRSLNERLAVERRSLQAIQGRSRLQQAPLRRSGVLVRP